MKTNNPISATEGLMNKKERYNKLTGFPLANVAETNDLIELVLEVPGYKPEDISVHFIQSRIFISGSRNENYSSRSRLHLSVERIANFHWVYDLKIPISKKDLQIDLENGFLFITVRKTEKGIQPQTENALPENFMEDSVYFPRANIVETENHIELSLEIPGYKNEDVSIHSQEGKLEIRGKRSLNLYIKEMKYRRIEVPFRNKFLRRFELPENTNHGQLSWSVQQGILYVFLPKLSEIRKEEVSRESQLA
ncbi:MAG: Hsp20/alpha crystallin family protein [Bacteroidetes bacterium]|nr:Hsp20/alpha crystallin family protein [Bacteroidota bacterium]MBL0064717.1 Hsp20/alpha crystallin family protein [Bacteroidota bacterium]MBL0137326.1 Hsp20/alpha crystallin family protein [Bacteroidota bacterium]